MIGLINLGRFAMIAWAFYGLLLVFAPAFLHRPPNQVSGAIQFVLAYACGYALDRLLGRVRRRQASMTATVAVGSDSGSI